jgi:hypothetical protein
MFLTTLLQQRKYRSNISVFSAKAKTFPQCGKIFGALFMALLIIIAEFTVTYYGKIALDYGKLAEFKQIFNILFYYREIVVHHYIFWSIQNKISAFKISPTAISKLATPNLLLSNQKILLVLLKSYFKLKNIYNIFRVGP